VLECTRQRSAHSVIAAAKPGRTSRPVRAEAALDHRKLPRFTAPKVEKPNGLNLPNLFEPLPAVQNPRIARGAPGGGGVFRGALVVDDTSGVGSEFGNAMKTTPLICLE
jgi:hypothetical protein